MSAHRGNEKPPRVVDENDDDDDDECEEEEEEERASHRGENSSPRSGVSRGGGSAALVERENKIKYNAPKAVLLAMSVNSRRSGFVHFFTNRTESFMNSFRGAMAMSATSIFSLFVFCSFFLFFFSDEFSRKSHQKKSPHLLKNNDAIRRAFFFLLLLPRSSSSRACDVRRGGAGFCERDALGLGQGVLFGDF